MRFFFHFFISVPPHTSLSLPIRHLITDSITLRQSNSLVDRAGGHGCAFCLICIRLGIACPQDGVEIAFFFSNKRSDERDKKRYDSHLDMFM